MTAERKRNVTFSIGAPSLTAIDANERAAKDFAAEDLPLPVKITNKSMFAIILPGFFQLKPLYELENCSATVTIKSPAALRRLISDLQSIAENNKKSELVTLEAEVIDRSLPVVPPVVDMPPLEPAAGDAAPVEPAAADVPAIEPAVSSNKKAKGG